MKTSDDYYETIDKAATIATPVFSLFGWTHHDKDRSPTHSELVSMLTDLVDGVLKSAQHSEDHSAQHATGRFRVSYYEYDDEKNLSISLELSDHSDFKEFK